jgi:hypothetical protein
MKEKRADVVKTSMKVGAVLGGIVFLIFGIVPGFHFGGAGTVMLLSKLMGGPVEFTLFLRMMVVLGILLGICCLGTLSIVLGSIAGTVTGLILNAFGVVKEPDAETKMAPHHR